MITNYLNEGNVFMKEIQIQELKQLQLEILSSIDKYCRKKDIKYFLTSGTCIGAVRHGGYIPWDDDIDIGMTRPHYERFIREYNGDVEKDPNLKVFAPELDWNYYAPYANVCDMRTVLDEGMNGHNKMELGVKIDVFPIDGIPTTIEEYQLEKEKMNRLWDILYTKRFIIQKSNWPVKSKMLMAIKKVLLCMINYDSIQKEIRDLALSNKYQESKYAIDIIFPWKRDVMCEKEVYEDLIEVPFENLNVFIMRNYDRYLSLKYGDYMQLPPKDQRIAHHDFVAWWK